MTVTTTLPVDEASRLVGGEPPRRRRTIRVNWRAWLFAGPSLIILLAFVAFPIVQSFWFSLHDWKIGATTQEWLGLANYERLFTDPLF